MVFFSVHAVQRWPGHWAQVAISLACILPAIVVFFKVGPELIKNTKLPLEIKFVLIIVVLGLINICFSENQWESFKGMGLFLMSGILVFAVSYFVLNSRQAQEAFFYLCSFCFCVLLIFGAFEFFQQIRSSGERILLLSSNPIPAGSLLILLSVGPLFMFVQAEKKGGKVFWGSCLLVGIILIILIGQKGPVLALIVLAFVGVIGFRKASLVLILLALIIVCIGYQFENSVPLQYKKQILKFETVLIRMEFYHVALDVVKEKPIFGLGFNSSLSRFITPYYEGKIFSKLEGYSFYGATAGIRVFDNMFLSFLCEMGGLFTLVYIGLFAYTLKNIVINRENSAFDNIPISLLLMVIAGFLAHSMTFDSLKYPHLNWLFHSILCLMAHSQAFRQTEKI
jgi:O-antigen ligase